MSDIKLNKRYPESRLEDITDAYTRGFEVGLAMRADENEKLRELLREILNNCCEGIESTCDMCGCYRKSDGACMADVMAIELGVDV